MSWHERLIGGTTEYIKAQVYIEDQRRNPSIVQAVAEHVQKFHPEETTWLESIRDHIAAYQAGEITMENLKNA